MASTITISGAGGTTVTLPFSSTTNLALAQQLAASISNNPTIQKPPQGTDPGTPSNPVSGLPTIPNGQTGLISLTGAAGATNVTLPTNYTNVIDTATIPVTVDGSGAQTAPFSILGGDGGLTFLSGSNGNGGSIYVDGGTNLLEGQGGANDSPTSTNGGLQGNYTIATGNGPGSASTIYLASGTDSISLGGKDIVYTGAANATINGSSNGNADTVSLGSGNVSFYGGTESGDRILRNSSDAPTGNEDLRLGTGGNGIIVAGNGNATLVGGGNGDLLFGSTDKVNQALFASGNETLLGGGQSSDLFAGFSTLNFQGNVAMTAANGTGNNGFFVGAGNDTIWAGLGSDSIFFDARYTGHTASGATIPGGNDLIFNFNTAKDVVALGGYTGNPTLSNGPNGATLSLSDGTTVTFAGVTDVTKIQIKPGPY
jgi:hypothetical protein